MKPFTATHTHAQNSIREHSPIYDLAAYQQRQRKLKKQRLLKNLTDTAIFISMAGFTFSTLFWGV
ncbi:hypothetical protein ABFO59_06280 [Acinetobacter radioresistens]|uniref:hypothetical protein n=1 Tax=Acinetobacter radioresistens TaxID=40216 RepID=UPI0032147E98